MIVEKRVDELKPGDVLPVGAHRYKIVRVYVREYKTLLVLEHGQSTFPNDSLFDVEVEEKK